MKVLGLLGAERDLVRAASLACLLVSLVVFGGRAWSATAAANTPPGVIETSGCEEETLHSLWRLQNHQSLYPDPSRLPYVAAYFNWLFYRIYAHGTAWLTAGPEQLPRASRWLTAGFALAGTALLGLLLTRVAGGQPWLGAGLAALVWLGPVMGWWAHTARPDAAALFFETAGLAALLLGYHRRPLPSIALAALLFYAAWACKQSYLIGLGTAGLFLLWRRQWLAALALGGMMALGCTLTFAWLGPDYRAAFHETVAANIYRLDLGLAHLADALRKSLPLVLLAGVALVRPRGQPTPAATTPLADDVRLLSHLGLLAALPLVFVASCKQGASSYYYLPVLTLLALAVASRRTSRGLTALAFALGAAIQLAVLLGFGGQLSLSGRAQRLAETWSVWRHEAEPRYAHTVYLNLPWLNPDSPSLVLAYNYRTDRAAGRPFEAGGIGGLIEQGYFRSLLLPAGTRDTYDGASLRLYQRGDLLHDLVVYRRKPPPP
jgi:hypothetical protein